MGAFVHPTLFTESHPRQHAAGQQEGG